MYGTIPREIAMAILREMEVPETEIRMAEGTYGDTKRRVLCAQELSKEF